MRQARIRCRSSSFSLDGVRHMPKPSALLIFFIESIIIYAKVMNRQ